MIEIKQTLEKQKREDGGKKFGVHITIFGAKGSGKTQKMKSIMNECFKKPVVYRMTDDFDKIDGIAIFRPNNFKENLDDFLHWLKKMCLAKKIDSVIFDEADRLFPSRKDLSDIAREFVDEHRHWGCSVIFASRRPQNLNTMTAEEGQFMLVFAGDGDNFIKKLKSINSELAELVLQLNYKDYRYVVKELGKPPEIKAKDNI